MGKHRAKQELETVPPQYHLEGPKNDPSGGTVSNSPVELFLTLDLLVAADILSRNCKLGGDFGRKKSLAPPQAQAPPLPALTNRQENYDPTEIPPPIARQV